MSHTLPALNYAYDALEPHFDKQTMEIHHSKHHQAYINNLNNLLEGLDAINLPLEDLMKNISKQSVGVRNNGGGHFNHSLFWKIIGPEQGKISEELESAITHTFGSLEAFKEEFNKAGMTRFGSGWAWLCVKEDGSLCVCSTANQDNPLMDIAECPGTPILGCDVWEHAYYLHYQNRRNDYLSAFWNVVNWDVVSQNYSLALGK